MLIKRYPNRKLYDTEAKQYITLDGIADLIRQGEEIQVVDHASGEDLTTLTLTQIIMEREKRKSGFLPRKFLAEVIHAGGDTLIGLQKNLASIGTWRQVDEEIQHRVHALIDKGELPEIEGLRLIDLLIGVGASSRTGRPDLIEVEIMQALEKRAIPTRADLQHLASQLESLSDRLDDLVSPKDYN
jgi:polyhydroxyalkanoate synthesis repressor PhaR